MSNITAKQLHNQTKAILDEVERGASFGVTRNGQVVGSIQPVGEKQSAGWDEIMESVWAAQKKCKTKASNTVLAERQRNRR